VHGDDETPQEHFPSEGSVARALSRSRGLTLDQPGNFSFKREGPTRSDQVRSLALCAEEVEAFQQDASLRVRAAGARLLGGLEAMSRRSFNVEAGSVYGAVILLPRSLAWPAELASLVVTAFTHYLLLIFLHGALLTFIDKEEVIQDAFAGQMHLCNFGAGLAYCGDGEGCPGPAGTRITAPRLYNWNQWATRLFVRDAFQALWPDRAGDIADVVDPGEYGVESNLCRLICCFVYVLMITPEIGLCWEMASLLWHVPSEDEAWVSFHEDRSFRGPKESWMKMVEVRVAGMNRLWKAACALFVLLPKCFLCAYSAKAGVFFLMESSEIDTVIVNSIALVFLLSLDEVMETGLMHDQIRQLLHMCEPFVMDESLDAEDHLDDLGSLRAYEERCGATSSWRRLLSTIFLHQYCKLYIVTLLTPLLVGYYYYQFCEYRDGQFISRSMYLPKSTNFNALNTFLPFLFPVQHENEPFWEMPDPN